MKIDDMKPGNLYRVTRIADPMEFAYVGATGLAIIHPPGEPDMQSAIAVPADDCSPTDARDPIAEIKGVYANTGPEPRDGDYVELLDENDPEGVVVLRRADGSEVMCMSRETYEALMKRGARHTENGKR